ncbi:MAG: PEP/pyruvate-binding domain-containing protein, partial [Elusimicrobiota bacterium]
MLMAPALSSAQVVSAPAAPMNGAAAASAWVPVMAALPPNFFGLDLTQPGKREALLRVLELTNIALAQGDETPKSKVHYALIDAGFKAQAILKKVPADDGAARMPGKEAARLAAELADFIEIRAAFTPGLQAKLQDAAKLLRKAAVPKAEQLASFQEAGQWAKKTSQDVLPLKTAPASPLLSGLKAAKPADSGAGIHERVLPSQIGHQRSSSVDPEFNKLFQELLAADGALSRGEALEKMIELGWTPQRKKLIRELFLTTDDRRFRELLLEVFCDDSFGFPKIKGLLDVAHFVLWLYPDDYAKISQAYNLYQTRSVAGIESSVFFEPKLIYAWAGQERLLESLAPQAYAEWRKGRSDTKYSQADLGFLLPDMPESVSEDGYRWPYPLTQGSLKSGRPQLWIATVSQTLLPPDEHQELKKHYALFDRIIDSNFQVLGSMSSQADSLTRSGAKLLLRQTRRMADLYHRLRGDSGDAAAISRTQKAYERIVEKLRHRWQDLSPEEKLPESPARLIFKLDASRPMRSLNALINWMHQKAIALFGQDSDHRGKDSGAFRSGEHLLTYVYVGDEPLYSVLLRSTVLKQLLMNLDRIHNISSDKLIFNESRLQLHAHFGCHTAEIYADLSEPDDGGMLRIRYKESGEGNGSRVRMEMISAVLKPFGMSVEITGSEYMTVLWDKDHGLDSSRSIATALPFILQFLHSTRDIDLMLRPTAAEEGKDLARKMGAVYLAEASWAFDSGESNEVMLKRFRSYQGNESARKKPREKADAELKRLGLPPIPKDVGFGQRTIHEFLTKPVEEASARGELVWDGSSMPQRSLDYAPLESLASAILSEPEKSALSASTLETLADSVLEYVPIGMIGALRAERAQLRLDDGSILTVNALRELASGRLAYAQASVWRMPYALSPQAAKKADPKKTQSPKSKKGKKASSKKKKAAKIQAPPASNRPRTSAKLLKGPLTAPELMVLLQQNGYAPRSGEALSASQQRRLQSLLKAPLMEEAQEQAQAFGVPASPGKGEFSTGPLLFDKKKMQEGAVLAVPYTSPDDIEAISRSAAVLTTGGGSLSHAAITTRELGLPSAILSSAHWTKDGEKPVLGLRLAQRGKTRTLSQGLQAADLSVVEDSTLREGDLVRVYGKSGEAALIARADDDSLQKAYRALEALRSGAREPGQKTILDILGIGRWFSQGIAKPELDWGWYWNERVERFFLEEARSDPRYAAQKELILGALMRHARHLSAAELAALAPAAVKARASSVPSSEDAAADPASSQPGGPSASTIRKPLWSRLEKKLEQSVDKDRLMALLRRMIRRDGADAGDDPAYQRLSALDLKAREKRMLELAAKEPSFLDLADIDDDMKPLVGGKSAKLGEMLQALAGQDAYVPEGLALTIYAYKRFLAETGLEDKVRALAMELDALLNASGMDEASRSKEISRLSERIRQVLMSAKLDAEKGVGRDILEALKPHGFSDQSARWSVRSSAIQEDSDDAAFAGAAESYLNLKPEEVLSKVVENWASFWLPRGILYRQRQGLR